jgi:hypothetical protein
VEGNRLRWAERLSANWNRPLQGTQWSKQNVLAAQRLLQSVIETMFTRYYRQREIEKLTSIDVRQFPYPWLV